MICASILTVRPLTAWRPLRLLNNALRGESAGGGEGRGEEREEGKRKMKLKALLSVCQTATATARKGGRGSKGSHSRREGGAGRSKNRIPDAMGFELFGQSKLRFE